MHSITDWLQQQLGLSPALQGRMLLTLVVSAALWVLHRLVLTFVYHRVTDPWSRYRWRKGATYVAQALGLLIVGPTWLPGMETYLAVLSAGIAIALRDPISNLAGWAFIVWRRPFDVGDRIEISGHAGDVIDVRLFQFTLNEIRNWVDADQSTGRIIHIPNNRIFIDPVANFDKGFKYIWNEVPVLVTFESNWKKAKQILTEIATKHAEHLTTQAEQDLLAASRQYLISYTKLTPIVYTRVVEDGVRLTMRYLIEPRRRRGTEQAIWEDVLTEFAKQPDVELGYITRRGFNAVIEGKPGIRTRTDQQSV